jgi:hypothetical protein
MITYNDTYWDAIRIEKAAIEELTEKNQILQQEKEEESRQKEQINIKLAIKMKRYGESIEEIIKETELSKDKVEQL